MSILSQTVAQGIDAMQPGAPYIVRNFEQLKNQTLTVAAAAGAVATLKRVENQTGAVLEVFSLVAGGQMQFGPFPTNRFYRLEVSAASVTYSIDIFDNDYATQTANVEGFSASRTLQPSDNGKLLRNDSASNLTITVPNSLPTGFNVSFSPWSTGSITLAPASGATNRSGKTGLATQYSQGSLLVVKNADAASAEYVAGGSFA